MRRLIDQYLNWQSDFIVALANEAFRFYNFFEAATVFLVSPLFNFEFLMAILLLILFVGMSV